MERGRGGGKGREGTLLLCNGLKVFHFLSPSPYNSDFVPWPNKRPEKITHARTSQNIIKWAMEMHM